MHGALRALLTWLLPLAQRYVTRVDVVMANLREGAVLEMAEGVFELDRLALEAAMDRRVQDEDAEEAEEVVVAVLHNTHGGANDRYVRRFSPQASYCTLAITPLLFTTAHV
jgi:hypothetical protein